MKKKPAKDVLSKNDSISVLVSTVTCVYGYHRASRWFKHSTVLNIHDRYKLEFVAHHWRTLLLLIGLDEVLVKLHAVLRTNKQTNTLQLCSTAYIGSCLLSERPNTRGTSKVSDLERLCWRSYFVTAASQNSHDSEVKLKKSYSLRINNYIEAINEAKF